MEYLRTEPKPRRSQVCDKPPEPWNVPFKRENTLILINSQTVPCSKH